MKKSLLFALLALVVCSCQHRAKVEPMFNGHAITGTIATWDKYMVADGYDTTTAYTQEMTKYESSKLYMSEDGVETSIICVKYSSKTKKVYDVVYTVLLPSGGTTVTEYNNMLERLTAKYGKSNDLSRMKHYKKASQVMDKSMMSGAYWVDKHNKLCLEILAYSDISTITDNAGWAGKIMNLFMSDNGAIAVHYLNPEVDNEIEKEKIDNL